MTPVTLPHAAATILEQEATRTLQKLLPHAEPSDVRQIIDCLIHAAVLRVKASV